MITDDMTLELILDKQRDSTVQVKQGDSGRNLKIYIKDNGREYDLTNKNIKFYAESPDGSILFNNVNILDAVNGICEVKLTSKVLSKDGEVKCEIRIIQGSKNIKSYTFIIKVKKSLYISNIIESTDEFDALNNLVNEVKVLKDSIEEIIKNLESNKNFVHNQIFPSSTWTIEHNLNRFPIVTVIDSNNCTVMADVIYNDSNNLEVRFTNDFVGKAYIN